MQQPPTSDPRQQPPYDWQTPPLPPQGYTQYPQQPPFYPQPSQQGRHMSAGVMPPSPLPQQPKKRKLPIWAWVIIVFLALAICSGISQSILQSAKGQSSVTQTATSVPTTDPSTDATAAAIDATTQTLTNITPTDTPAPQLTPTTALQGTSGDAILGSAIDPFIAKFGQPTVMGTGAYDFQNHTIEVVTGDNLSMSILEDSPNNTTWTLAQAKAICLALSPSDAHYERSITLSNNQGEQYVYVSPSLAKEFQASVFTDENGNQATAGTFGIVLTYAPNSTSQFDSCSTQVGLQGT